ncbi:glycosyltransferase family 4 protein [bacterium]|nr:glycosyltransferase family 4 protein [bacterium]
MSKRVLVIWSRLPGYGIASLLELKSVLGDELMVCSYGSIPDYVSQRELALLGVAKEFKFSDPWYKRFKDLYDLVFVFKPDFFIVSGWQYPVLLFWALMLRLAGAKTISMIDTPYKGDDRSQKRKMRVGAPILRLCFSKVWVAGKLSRKLMELSGFQSKRIIDSLYCADSHRYGNGETYQLDDYLIYVGRLAPEKNIEFMLDSFIEYRSNFGGRLRLLVVGDGDIDISSYKRFDYLKFYGSLNSSDISNLMKNARAFVLLSNYEPWGVVVHEAVLSGLPLILSSNVGAHYDFLDDRRNGFLVEGDEVQQVASYIAELENDELTLEFKRHSKLKANNRNLTNWCDNVVSKVIV